MYLNSENLLKHFMGRKCYVYGAGDDGKNFYTVFSEQLEIAGFIVSARHESFLLHMPVFSSDICRNDEVKGNIIIATRKYEKEICDYLCNLGLIKGEDFFVWDKDGLHDPDTNALRLIEWNDRIWKKKRVGFDGNKILIPIESSFDSNVIYYAYLTDLLNKQYNAEIECYIRNGNNDVYEVMKSLYRSFGVQKIIYPNLTKEQEKRADYLFDVEWGKINSFSDWNKITIFGISFGLTIIRSYLRFKELDISPRSETFKAHLYECIRTIVFWYDRFEKYDYKVVIMWDGVHWEGFIREIALSRGIPVYASTYRHGARLCHEYPSEGGQHIFYKSFWQCLSNEEKKLGIKWAQDKLSKRLNGQARKDSEVIPGKDPYAIKKSDSHCLLQNNNKLKIMIAMHMFSEDSYAYGEQIFDNNYISWLIHLGEISKKLDRYDWYIKLHPHGDIRDDKFIEIYLKEYPHIKKIDRMVSPIQLRDEGLKFVLDIHGTIGSEYPLLGIQVINAGINPHIAFGFNWNPTNKQKYDELLYNLENLNNLDYVDEIYQFYAIHRLFYNHKARTGMPFFEGFGNREIGMWNDDFEFEGIKKEVGTWKFSAFLDEITEEKHIKLCNRVEEILDQLGNWEPRTFYKRDIGKEVQL